MTYFCFSFKVKLAVKLAWPKTRAVKPTHHSANFFGNSVFLGRKKKLNNRCLVSAHNLTGWNNSQQNWQQQCMATPRRQNHVRFSRVSCVWLNWIVVFAKTGYNDSNEENKNQQNWRNAVFVQERKLVVDALTSDSMSLYPTIAANSRWTNEVSRLKLPGTLR